MNRYLIALVVSLVGFPGMIRAQQPSAASIIKQAEDKMRGSTSYTEMTMTIVRPSYQRSISLKSWSKDKEFSLIKITAPAKEKGSGYLKRNKELWNWLPTIDRMIKMSSSVMGQSWMGSDFTNDDMVRESSMTRDYTPKLLPKETLRGVECYVIDLTPLEAAAVVWGKTKVWISVKDYSILRTENYDESIVLMQTLDNYDFKRFGDRDVATRMEMIPADKKGQKTIVTVSKAEYNKPIADSFFSQQNLKTVQ